MKLKISPSGNPSWRKRRASSNCARSLTIILARTPEESAGDLEILTSAIRARLLELQSIQMWRKNPDLYTSDLSDSIFVIMRRNFAPPDERLRSLVARELQAPKVLEAARQNLRNPPQVYTQVALQQLPDTIQFFQKDVPEAFRQVKDPELLASFKKSNDAVVEKKLASLNTLSAIVWGWPLLNRPANGVRFTR